jgi:hypothetical protein
MQPDLARRSRTTSFGVKERVLNSVFFAGDDVCFEAPSESLLEVSSVPAYRIDFTISLFSCSALVPGKISGGCDGENVVAVSGGMKVIPEEERVRVDRVISLRTGENVC